VAEVERMPGLYVEQYSDFTMKHFHEQMVKRHGYKLGYTVTRLSLQAAGLVRPAPRRSVHRKKRTRRPLPGMMLHQDASRFPWLGGEVQHDLVVTLDDATSAIYSAFLIAEEGTACTMRGLGEVIERQGLFRELCTDRGSHYFYTPKAGEPVSRRVPTQVGRALAQLGIGHIAAYSPEARGRSERAFRTLQDRLPKERRLAKVTTIEAANVWLIEHYIAMYNTAFTVTPDQEGTAFVTDRAGAWREALCIQEDRRVGNDNTIAWRKLRPQIPPGPIRPHHVRAMVRVHEYPNGQLAIFHGPHRLANYRPDGTLIEETLLAA
jgi:hypothetical protein